MSRKVEMGVVPPGLSNCEVLSDLHEMSQSEEGQVHNWLGNHLRRAEKLREEGRQGPVRLVLQHKI